VTFSQSGGRFIALLIDSNTQAVERTGVCMAWKLLCCVLASFVWWKGSHAIRNCFIKNAV